jgi:hypothetical protein
MSREASDLYGFFETTYVNENGYGILYVDSKESAWGRYTDSSCKRNVTRLMGEQEIG